MEIFVIAVVLGLIVLAVKYYLDYKENKNTNKPEEQAPYKVEPPTEVYVDPLGAPYATSEPVKTPPVSSATPELKVVSGTKKTTAKPRSKSRTKTATTPATTSPKPKATRKPAEPKPIVKK